MRVKSLHYILFLFYMIAACNAAAQHFSTIIFDNKTSEREDFLISRYLEGLDIVSYGTETARADLNEDGAEEIIIRSGCVPDGPCIFHILALNEEKAIPLAKISARYINLGNGYSAGVRNIIAYKNTANDFDHAVYIWEPSARQYMIKE